MERPVLGASPALREPGSPLLSETSRLHRAVGRPRRLRDAPDLVSGHRLRSVLELRSPDAPSKSPRYSARAHSRSGLRRGLRRHHLCGGLLSPSLRCTCSDDQLFHKPVVHQPTRTTANRRASLEGKFVVLQVFSNNGEQPRYYLPAFARRRSGVRIPSAPLLKNISLQVKRRE